MKTINDTKKLVTFPFLIREGLTAFLYLPEDLKLKEAKRLKKFVKTLAI